MWSWLFVHLSLFWGTCGGVAGVPCGACGGVAGVSCGAWGRSALEDHVWGRSALWGVMFGFVVPPTFPSVPTRHGACGSGGGKCCAGAMGRAEESRWQGCTAGVGWPRTKEPSNSIIFRGGTRWVEFS